MEYLRAVYCEGCVEHIEQFGLRLSRDGCPFCDEVPEMPCWDVMCRDCESARFDGEQTTAILGHVVHLV